MPASKPCVHRLEKTPGWNDTTDEEWATPSLAVVACRGGHGVVLWYGGGPSLAFEIEEGGLAGLDDLGLDDAPEGISIWTGRYVTTGGPSIPGYCDDSIETTPKGSFRQPDANEWHDIRMGRNPWPRLRCSKCGGEASRPGPVLDGSDANLCERCEHAVCPSCERVATLEAALRDIRDRHQNGPTNHAEGAAWSEQTYRWADAALDGKP